MAGADDDQFRWRRHDFEEHFELASACRESQRNQLVTFPPADGLSLSRRMASTTLGVADRFGSATLPSRIRHLAPGSIRPSPSTSTTVSQHRRFALLGDLDEFFRQRTHLPLAASWSRSFHHGSMKTFMMPPHTAGLSDEISSSRSIRTVRGLRVRITSMASRFTSASPQPPPMVPRISPQAVTTILAPTSRGVEPLADTMVATATVSPLSRNSFTW